MYRRPIITLAGNGDEIALDGVGDGYTLKPGSTGLGLGPHEYATAPVPGADGVTIRNRRIGARDILLPIDVWAPTYGELEAMRRRLEAIVTAEQVEVRVYSEWTGETRSAFGVYKDGLDGDFAWATGRTAQTIPLTITCPDPWWYGPERSRVWELGRRQKPYLHPSIPHYPVLLAPSTILGAFEFTVTGEGPVLPVWRISAPASDLEIQCTECDDRIFLDHPITSELTIDTRVQDLWMGDLTSGELFDHLSEDSTLFSLQPGRRQIRVVATGARPETQISLTYRERWRAGH